MDSILNFAKDNYIILLVLGAFFLLALIGYFYDKYQHRDITIAKDEKTGDAILTENTMNEEKQAQANGTANAEGSQQTLEQQSTEASTPPVETIEVGTSTVNNTPPKEESEEDVPIINGLE